MGHILGELHLDDAALNLYEKLHQGVFEHSLYIKSQIAKIYYSLRGCKQIGFFKDYFKILL